jgi:hypothetical protein
VAATPKGGLVVVADDWPKASENAFLLVQQEHDNCAAALIAAIESMEGDLVLGGLWFLGSGKGKFEAERARIAKSGKMPLVIALAAYSYCVMNGFAAGIFGFERRSRDIATAF